MRKLGLCLLSGILSALVGLGSIEPVYAPDHPAPHEANWGAAAFRFHTGDVCNALAALHHSW